MNLYEFKTPKQLKAGSVGTAQTPFYHPCADCDAQEPVIYGCLAGAPPVSTCDPTFGVIKKGAFFALAVFCKPCFDKRVMDGFDHCCNETQNALDRMKAEGDSGSPEYMKLVMELRQLTADRLKQRGLVVAAV